eukprot:scaffold49_cov409-Prasinococcus_capsulatus_cf.AAC.41
MPDVKAAGVLPDTRGILAPAQKAPTACRSRAPRPLMVPSPRPPCASPASPRVPAPVGDATSPIIATFRCGRACVGAWLSESGRVNPNIVNP